MEAIFRVTISGGLWVFVMRLFKTPARPGCVWVRAIDSNKIRKEVAKGQKKEDNRVHKQFFDEQGGPLHVV